MSARAKVNNVRLNARTALVTALVTFALAVGGVAWAYWSDSGVVNTSGTISTATYVPAPNLNCSAQATYNHQITWSMPNGEQVTGWIVTLSKTGPSNFQPVGSGTPPANLGGTGTWTLGANGTSAVFGLISPGFVLFGPAQNNSGSVSVKAVINGWESAATSINWTINFAATTGNATVGCG